MLRYRSELIALTAFTVIAVAGPIALVWASVDGTCSIQMQINDRRTVGLTKSVNIGISPTPSVTFSDGVGAGAANQIYQATRTMSGGADSIDLTGSSFKDSYGDNLTLARVKALYIKNTSTHTLTFGGGTAPWTTFVNPIAGTLAEAAIVLPPGAFILVVTPDATGWAVTATTGDLLNSTGTTTDTYDIAILGAKT